MNTEKYKLLLLQRKAELIKILEDFASDDPNCSKCDIKEDLDFASISSDISRDYELYKKQKEELIEVSVGLKKIEEGTYGICEMCDEEISEKRLEIKPYAKYCITCRSIIEKERR